MPISQRLLLYIPTPLLGLLIISAFIALSILGLVIVRRFVPHHRLKVHNDVAGAIFNTAGVAYAVLLAFVVVMVWQSFDKCVANVEKESNCLADLYRDSSAFPQAFKGEIRRLVRDYVGVVIEEEWPLLTKGWQSSHARSLFRDISEIYCTFEPKTESEKIFLAESVRKLNEAGELRRLRLVESRTGLHPIIWFVLVVGGAVTIIFTFFFGSENFSAQILMASMLATIISLILFTILLLDFPFTGGLSIPADAFMPLVSLK